MGALPKRRISKARKGNRRAHNALEVPAVVKCPKCGKAKRPHFKCEYCGFYGKLEKKSTKTSSIKTASEKSTKKKTESTKE